MSQGTSLGTGVRRSLGGVMSRPNTGLISEKPDAAITFNPGTELLHSNQNRVAAIIQNLDVNPMLITMETGTGIPAVMSVPAGGSFQIDEYFPWCGAVFVSSVTGNVTYIELSIQS